MITLWRHLVAAALTAYEVRYEVLPSTGTCWQVCALCWRSLSLDRIAPA